MACSQHLSLAMFRVCRRKSFQVLLGESALRHARVSFQFSDMSKGSVVSQGVTFNATAGRRAGHPIKPTAFGAAYAWVENGLRGNLEHGSKSCPSVTDGGSI